MIKTIHYFGLKKASTNLASPFHYNNNNNNNITHDQSSASNHHQAPTKATTMNQEPLQQFKYHLNHLRPPSLVPITIQQVAASGKYPPDESFFSASRQMRTKAEPSSSGGALQASEPSPVLALIESRWSPNTKMATQTDLDGQSDESQKSHLQQTDNRNNLLPNNNNNNTNTSKQDSYVASDHRNNDMRLVQLQLPLQLHLKLKPLPLPMPPPTGRSRSSPTTNHDDQRMMNAAEKRRRSIESINVTSTSSNSNSNSIPVTKTPTSTPSATSSSSTTADSVASKNRADRDRRELMALTWREAKRILLLSSMSPTLVQKKLERRTADFPEAAELSTRPAVGDSASVWAPKVDTTSTVGAVTTASAPSSTASSGLLRQRKQVELEQSTTANPRWNPVQQQRQQQQQPPTTEPLLPTTTYKSNSNLLQTTTATAPASTAAQVNPSSLSPSLAQTVAQTTPLPQATTTKAASATTTTTSTFATTGAGIGEVRRQRHSSQLQVSNDNTNYYKFSFFFFFFFNMNDEHCLNAVS